jgi:hypothetical protein
MRSILDIYKEYKIHPQLEQHMLTVTGIVLWIGERSKTPFDIERVFIAALLHDMGNIVKFKFDSDLYPISDEERNYWKKTQAEFFEKYGKDEYTATLAIVSELGMPKEITALLGNAGFNSACSVLAEENWEQKVLNYADMRVGPYGVVSLEERLVDLKNRYGKKIVSETETEADKQSGCLRELEKQLFLQITGRPEEITQETIDPYIQELRTKNI